MTRKPTAYILLLVTACALLAGCGRSVSDADRLLARIDSLADVDPDSADLLLKPTPSPSLKGWEKDEVALLLRIKVDDKLYRPVTHYRDTILQLVSYFEQHPKVLPSVLGSTGPALPYLYAGRIFADLGDAPQALDYYQRALDAQPAGQMENGKWKIENEDARRLAKQRGLLHSLIGETFYFQGLYREAIVTLKKANNYAIFAGDTLGQIFNYRDIAEDYKNLMQTDSSMLFYDHALTLARQSHNITICNDVMAQMARLHISLGNYVDAKKFIFPALHHLDSADISSTYSIASKIYKYEGKHDSALFCYNKLLKFGNIYGKRYAHRELSELAMQHSDLHVATEHFRQYKLLDDSIRVRDNAEVVSRMHAAYNYQQQEHKAQQLELSNARKQHSISIILFCTVFAAVGIFHYIKRVHRKQQRMAQKIEKLQHKLDKRDNVYHLEAWESQVKDYENKIRELLAQMDSSKQERLNLQAQIGKLEDEKRTLEYMIRRVSKTEDMRKEAHEALAETSIYKHFERIAMEQEKPASDEKWKELKELLETNYLPEFKDNIQNLCTMSEHEYRMCLLFKCGFKKARIARILLIDRSAISHAFSRLYQRTTGKKGSSEDWEKIIDVL